MVTSLALTLRLKDASWPSWDTSRARWWSLWRNANRQFWETKLIGLEDVQQDSQKEKKDEYKGIQYHEEESLKEKEQE